MRSGRARHGNAGRRAYASLVLIATAMDGSPLLLLSDLAQHTQNLKRESRVSLLLDGTGGLEEALTGARLSLQGTVSAVEDAAAAARFVARHPGSALYAGFADFRLYRVTPERAHLVAGFGRIHWIETADLTTDLAGAAELAEAEAGIVAHMNEDHADALSLYASALLGLDAGAWRMTGVDPEGIDMRLGAGTARVRFGSRVETASSVRAELVKLVKQARSGTT